MEYRNLGNSGLKVSQFCFGTMTFGNSQWKLGGVDQGIADRMVGMALDAGINFFDTADVYSVGASEEMLGKALKTRRSESVIATKVRGSMGPGPNDVGLSRKHIHDAIDASLRRLGTDYVDLYQVHGWDPTVPLEETMDALNRVVEAGKVRYIGLSNFAAWQITKADGISSANGWAKFISAQMHYSLVNRDLESDVTPACLDLGLGILPWSPLSGGFLIWQVPVPRQGAGGHQVRGPQPLVSVLRHRPGLQSVGASGDHGQRPRCLHGSRGPRLAAGPPRRDIRDLGRTQGRSVVGEPESTGPGAWPERSRRAGRNH